MTVIIIKYRCKLKCSFIKGVQQLKVKYFGYYCLRAPVRPLFSDPSRIDLTPKVCKLINKLLINPNKQPL